MTMAVHTERRAVCPPTAHRHPVPATGGRCAFHSPGRPGDICGRDPVALYVNPAAKVRNTYRCAFHDRDVARDEAARQGFVRMEVGS